MIFGRNGFKVFFIKNVYVRVNFFFGNEMSKKLSGDESEREKCRIEEEGNTFRN
jgi:hypothetical protein